MIYVTGDTHGSFYDLLDYSVSMHLNKQEDTIIILGDAGINDADGPNYEILDKVIKFIPAKLFCIYGNHENRPSNIKSYKLIDYNNGKAYINKKYPNVIFAKDGETYDFIDVNNKRSKCFVIGGAYSVDKYMRLKFGYPWYPDEQPDNKIKKEVENNLNKINWSVDYIFSHTCPLKYEPREWFIPGLSQEGVDSSTEEWLQNIHNKMKYYNIWYLGHFHGSKVINTNIGKMRFMFHDIVRLGK